jgi:hypothetical protein
VLCWRDIVNMWNTEKPERNRGTARALYNGQHMVKR